MHARGLESVARDRASLERYASSLGDRIAGLQRERALALESLEHAEDCAQAVELEATAWLEDVGYGAPYDYDSLTVYVQALAALRILDSMLADRDAHAVAEREGGIAFSAGHWRVELHRDPSRFMDYIAELERWSTASMREAIRDLSEYGSAYLSAE